MDTNTAIIIQVRMSSSRFPGKMLTKLGGLALIEYVYRRCRALSHRKRIDCYFSDNEVIYFGVGIDNVSLVENLTENPQDPVKIVQSGYLQCLRRYI